LSARGGQRRLWRRWRRIWDDKGEEDKKSDAQGDHDDHRILKRGLDVRLDLRLMFDDVDEASEDSGTVPLISPALIMLR